MHQAGRALLGPGGDAGEDRATLRRVSRSSLLLGVILVIGLFVAVLAGAERSAEMFVRVSSTAPIRLFGPHPSLATERDMPAVVRARIAREQRRLVRLAKGAEGQPASRASGCVEGDFPGTLGPPAPRVTPRILGYQVEVLIEFARLPRSWQCRPWQLQAIVHSRDAKLNFDSHFAVEERRGRIVVNLPWFGHPPYRLEVFSETLFGRQGPTIEVPIRCPSTEDRVRGCLAGLAGFSSPKPELPIHGVTLSSLVASLDYLLEPQRRPPVLRAAPRAFRCRSLRVCEVTYIDEAFPASPFRVRYRITGQQVRGCWMGLHEGISGRRPYDDAGGGPPTLAACVSWVR
jgi:hypothetical protein